MEISFIPTPDVAAILNALLDKFENRAQRTPAWFAKQTTGGARERVEMEAEGTFSASRPVRIVLDDLDLPSYTLRSTNHSTNFSTANLSPTIAPSLNPCSWLKSSVIQRRIGVLMP
jgi:hypothetical protein